MIQPSVMPQQPGPRVGPRIVRASVLVLALVLSAAALPAQEPTRLVGRVLSSIDGGPIPGARVLLVTATLGAVSDSAGIFVFEEIDPGTHILRVSSFGFHDQRADLRLGPGTTRVRVVLEAEPIPVDPVTVETEARPTARLADFERRRKRGRGYFVTPAQIADRDANQPSDFLRTVPGVVVSRSILGRARVEIDRHGGRCGPMLYLDGKRARQLHIDDLNPHDILAIEIFRGAAEVPPEFTESQGGCGVIAVWTRGSEPPA